MIPRQGTCHALHGLRQGRTLYDLLGVAAAQTSALADILFSLTSQADQLIHHQDQDLHWEAQMVGFRVRKLMLVTPTKISMMVTSD